MHKPWDDLFIALQAFQLVFLLAHDWVPLGSLNDLAAVRSQNTTRRLLTSTLIGAVPVTLALCLTIFYFGSHYPLGVRIWLWLTYGILFAGELYAWWIPYLVRADAKRAIRYQAMFRNTHTFLPERNGITPNTLHIALHVSTVATLVILCVIGRRV